MPHPVRYLAVAAVVLIAGCSSSVTAAPAVPTSTSPMSMAMPPGTVTTSGRPVSRLVDPAAFATAIATSGTVTIDVHVPFEGKIAGTNLIIAYTDMAQQASKLPADHHTELAIYCRTGVMSAIAAKTLASLGYTNVVELHGGMYAWLATGRTLINTP
jgi:rhodanese-related sulfurtransferase